MTEVQKKGVIGVTPRPTASPFHLKFSQGSRSVNTETSRVEPEVVLQTLINASISCSRHVQLLLVVVLWPLWSRHFRKKGIRAPVANGAGTTGPG